MGLMLGIVVDKDERAAMVSQLMEKGVLVLTAGTEAIRLLPPLVITKEEMDEANCCYEGGNFRHEAFIKAVRLHTGGDYPRSWIWQIS